MASGFSCPGYFHGLKFYDQGAGLRRKYHYDECSKAPVTSNRSRASTSSLETGIAPQNGHSSIEGEAQVSHFYDDVHQPSSSGPNSKKTLRADIPLDPRLLSGITIPRESLDNPSYNRRPGVDSESFDQIIGPEDLPMPTAMTNSLELLPLPTSEGDVSSINATLEHSPPQFSTSTKDALSASVYSVFQKSTKASLPIDLVLQYGMVYSEGEEGSDFETLFLIRHFAEVIGPWQAIL